MKIPFPVRVIPALTFEAWLTPPPIRPATVRSDLESLNTLQRCYFGGVPGYEIGSGPLAIAAHGWGGRPGQMVSVARWLADEGYRVLVPELPGHAGGPKTDIKQAAAALRSIVDEVGEPDLVVAHSFAAMVLRLVYPEAGPPKTVLVAPALVVDDALDVFGDRLGLLPWARQGLRKRLEAWDPALWPTVSGILPDQLEGTEIMIVHDPGDRETPFSRSAELAALRPATSIVPMDGAGHSRILYNPVTLDYIAGFVTGHALSEDSAA